MALRDQWIPVRIGPKGLETERDDKTLEPGTPVVLENAVFERLGSISKRPGTDKLPRRIATSDGSYAQLSGAIGLCSRADESELVLLSSDDNVYSLSSAASLWSPRGSWFENLTETSAVPSSPNEAWDHTVAATGSVGIVAWQDQRTGVWAQLFSYPSWVPVGPHLRVTGHPGKQPRALAVGNRLHLNYVSGSVVAEAVFGTSDPTDRSFSVHQLHSSVTSSVATGQAPYDVCTHPSWGYAVMAVSQAPNKTQVLIVRSTGGVGSSGSVPAFPNPVTISGSVAGPAIAASQDGILVAIGGKDDSNGTGVDVPNAYIINTLHASSLAEMFDPAIADRSPAVVASDRTVRRHTLCFQSGTNVVSAVLELSASLPVNRSIRVASVFGDDTFGSGSLIRHSGLGSKPFTFQDDGRNYVWVNQPSTNQSTDFLVRIDFVPSGSVDADGNVLPGPRPLVCGVARPSLALTDVSGCLSEVQVRGDLAVRGATSRDLLNLISSSGSSFSGRYGVRMETERHPRTWSPIDIDGVLHMNGGWLGVYDGTYVVENGFALQVEGMAATVGSASLGRDGIQTATSVLSQTGPLSTASFQYVVIPEWFNAYGQRNRGSCLTPLTVPLSASLTQVQNTASLSWTSIVHTMKDGDRAPDIRFAVYRTGPNGTVFQRIDDPAAPILNLTGSDTISWVDTFSEGTRAVGEPLYYQPSSSPATGTPAVMPPRARRTAYNGDRLYLGDLDGDRNGLAVSDPRVPDEAMRFTDLGLLQVDPIGGPITNLAALDGWLVIFKRGRIYRQHARVQTDLDGTTSNYPEPELVTSDVGSVEGTDVVEVAGTTAQGLLFRSERGVRLLDRSFSVHDIGASMREFDILTPSAGIQGPASEGVRLYTEEGRTLVYDARQGQWSTFVTQPAIAAARWQGKAAYVGADGFVWVDNTGSYKDGDATYPMTIGLGWIPLGGLQGSSRLVSVDILGDYVSPHSLRLTMAYDYNDSIVRTREWPTSNLNLTPYGGPPGYGSGSYGSLDGVYQPSIPSPVQRCQAVKLTFSDVDREGDGGSFVLTEVKLHIRRASEKPRSPERKRR